MRGHVRSPRTRPQRRRSLRSTETPRSFLKNELGASALLDSNQSINHRDIGSAARDRCVFVSQERVIHFSIDRAWATSVCGHRACSRTDSSPTEPCRGRDFSADASRCGARRSWRVRDTRGALLHDGSGVQSDLRLSKRHVHRMRRGDGALLSAERLLRGQHGLHRRNLSALRCDGPALLRFRPARRLRAGVVVFRQHMRSLRSERRALLHGGCGVHSRHPLLDGNVRGLRIARRALLPDAHFRLLPRSERRL
jgi:hypothetical protein